MNRLIVIFLLDILTAFILISLLPYIPFLVILVLSVGLGIAIPRIVDKHYDHS